MIQLSFLIFFLYHHEVYKLHMVTTHMKSESNTKKRIEPVYVICFAQTSSKDEK